MAITEAFGEFRTGKTHIAHTLCGKSEPQMHLLSGPACYVFSYIFQLLVLKTGSQLHCLALEMFLRNPFFIECRLHAILTSAYFQ